MPDGSLQIRKSGTYDDAVVSIEAGPDVLLVAKGHSARPQIIERIHQRENKDCWAGGTPLEVRTSRRRYAAAGGRVR